MSLRDLDWLRISSPSMANEIGRFVAKHAANINGFERITDKRGNIAYMLGKQDGDEPVKYVAGISLPIPEFEALARQKLDRAMFKIANPDPAPVAAQSYANASGRMNNERP